MVSATERDKLVNGRQNNVSQGQQKLGKALADRPSKDGTAQRAAQDVEGLKGYVRESDAAIFRKELANLRAAIGRLSGQGSIRICLSGAELGHGRDGCH